MLPYLLILLAVAALALVMWMAFRRRAPSTVLRKVLDSADGETVRRVEIERPGLHARVWFEPDPTSPSSFIVHFRGDEDAFTVSSLGSEPIHIREAREALAELGLDLDKCSWADILKKAQ